LCENPELYYKIRLSIVFLSYKHYDYESNSINRRQLDRTSKKRGGKNITESIVIALKYYLQNQKIYDVLDPIDKEPLQFTENFTAYNIRKINREL